MKLRSTRKEEHRWYVSSHFLYFAFEKNFPNFSELGWPDREETSIEPEIT